MIYDFLLFLGALCLIPKWLLKKKYRGTISQRLGFSLPKKANKIPTVWIHMVSVGETKVMIPIYERLRKKYPKGAFFFSSSTKTGHQEAMHCLPNGDGYFFLPLDFSWTMRRLVFRYKPDLLFISESDFWPNLISQIKHIGGKIIVVNGKISHRSAARFAKIPKFSKRLFGKIDKICVQSEEYAKRFHSLYVPQDKITITGNVKLSIPSSTLTEDEKQHWRKKLQIPTTGKIITLGSTHEGEEELLLPHLTDYTVLLVPRHPERFAKVKKFLESHSYPNVHLVDQMGVLWICYQLSDAAIVGGSFLPGIGGHNIFEPIQAKIPVIFGPYMEAQKELVKLILEYNAGIQTPHENLKPALEKISNHKEDAQLLSQKGTEPAEVTWEAVQEYLTSLGEIRDY